MNPLPDRYPSAPRCPHAELHSPDHHADLHAANKRMVEEHGTVFPAEISPGIRPEPSPTTR